MDYHSIIIYHCSRAHLRPVFGFYSMALSLLKIGNLGSNKAIAEKLGTGLLIPSRVLFVYYKHTISQNFSLVWYELSLSVDIYIYRLNFR